MKNKRLEFLLSKKGMLFFFAMLCFISLKAEVKVPAIFSDNMMFQRDVAFSVWGWADKGESVEVVFNGQKKKTKANKNGEWEVVFNPMQYGGEYLMTIKGKKNTLTFNNILIGDIWVCSGQSNMEWTLDRAKNAEQEIANSNYPQIRSFNVTREMAFSAQNDFKGEWLLCTPQNAGSFSAVGYFFARETHKKTGIPIGFINSSWGGTVVEAWTSGESFAALPDKYKSKFPRISLEESKNIQEVQKENKIKYEKAIKNDLGTQERWFNPSINISDWQSFVVPQMWNNPELGSIDGVVWFQYDITLPEELAGKAGELSLGKIDDDDETWINGVKVGATKGYDIMRNYKIAENLLKVGKNRITVKIVDTGGDGGMYSDAEDLFLKIDGKKHQLKGDWKYQIAESNKKYNYIGYSANQFPSSLYNAMIHPMIKFAIKGAIWYQGESNAGDAYDYRTLFPNMINDWRAKWGKDISFYWVQLANYMAEDKEPKESDWAELREAQTMTLSLPRTGQAIITDIGEADDIHPRNKQDVGLRLALNALYKDYGYENIVYSAPTYKSMEIKGNKIIISFDQLESALSVKSKYGYVSGFAIAGSDKKFVWAKAYIEGNKIVVYSDEVQNPVAARYNWGNNPDGNVFNKEGLPLAPFRTDNWKGITEK